MDRADLRGFTRSGQTFAALNTPYYTSLAELKNRHKKLFSSVPGIYHSLVKEVGSTDVLARTSIRFRYDADEDLIKRTLGIHFSALFREHEDSVRREGVQVLNQ